MLKNKSFINGLENKSFINGLEVLEDIDLTLVRGGYYSYTASPNCYYVSTISGDYRYVCDDGTSGVGP